MKTLALTSYVEHFDDHLRLWRRQVDTGLHPYTLGELFTAWQLCWLFDTAQIACSDDAHAAISTLIERMAGDTPAEQLSRAWMRIHGLPRTQTVGTSHTSEALTETKTEKSQHTSTESFYAEVRAQLATDVAGTNNAECVFRYLQHIAGLSPQDRAEFDEFVFLASKTAQPQPARLRLEVMPDPTLWLAPETVATELAQFLSEAHGAWEARVTLVLLPAPLHTPMCWSLPLLQGGTQRHIVLGWPTGEATPLTHAEQRALLAHEARHLAQHLNLDATSEKAALKHDTLFQRELEAVTAEWNELNAQCANQSKGDAEKLRSRWLHTHVHQQLHMFQMDLESFAACGQSEKTSVRHFSKNETGLRMPFTSLIYALCARRVSGQTSVGTRV